MQEGTARGAVGVMKLYEIFLLSLRAVSHSRKRTTRYRGVAARAGPCCWCLPTGERGGALLGRGIVEEGVVRSQGVVYEWV